jgi:hypothetical protein
MSGIRTMSIGVSGPNVYIKDEASANANANDM